MLSRHLPFDSNDDKEIGRKTIYQPTSFSHPIWETVSPEAKDLVGKLLNKDRTQRITIKDALDHPWLSSSNQAISKMRKEAIDDGNEVAKFISYSNFDPKLANESNVKRSEAGKFSHGSGSPRGNCSPHAIQASLNHGPGSGNIDINKMNLLLDKKPN